MDYPATPFAPLLFTCSMSKKFKHAIVVGASSGIGEALVLELAKQGASVALVARRTQELQRVSESASRLSTIDNRPPDSKYPIFPHDVTNFSEVPALFQE